MNNESALNRPVLIPSSNSKTPLGFWIYLMTDCVLFATLFVVYAVLRNSTAGGATASELFSLPYVLIETLLLLTSSFTCGLVILAMHQRQVKQVVGWLAVTFILGALFLGMELAEFRHLVISGESWAESGFLSAFFTLVGTHGMHISAGLIWIAVLSMNILKKGLTAVSMKRLILLGMFWHFLDIVWIFIFTFVFLMRGL